MHSVAQQRGMEISMAMGTEAVFKNSRNNVGFGSNYQRLAQIAHKWLIQSVLLTRCVPHAKARFSK
jgi:hypothetical protein